MSFKTRLHKRSDDTVFGQRSRQTSAAKGGEKLLVGVCRFNSVFTKYTGVTSVLVPDSVTLIAYGAFGACTTLTNLTIGNSVTNIGYAFILPNDATIVTALYFRGNAPTIPSGWLGGYQFN